jgi:polar amino acid transport system permease protein
MHYLPAFRRGLIVSLALAFGSSVIGTLAGIPLAGLLRLSKAIALPLAVLIDALRAIPNLVLIFFFYYFPYRELLGIEPASPFASALLALIVAQAAYSADLFRAALDQVPRHHKDGLRALGFTEAQVWRYAVLPSLVRQTLPVQVAFWIGNLKLSSLASVIGVEDVVFVAKIGMSQNFRSLESWLFVAGLYTALVLPAAYALRYLEQSAWIKRQ